MADNGNGNGNGNGTGQNVAILTRFAMSDQGTEGQLITEGFSCFTLELPWRDNEKGISCIPPGEYQAIITKTNRYGLVYWLPKVDGRTSILIHWGNYAGDPIKGLKTHSMGCILLGKLLGFLGGQRAVLNSRVAVSQFISAMNYEPFILKVLEGI